MIQFIKELINIDLLSGVDTGRKIDINSEKDS